MYSSKILPKNGYTAISGKKYGFKTIEEFGILMLDDGQLYKSDSGGNEIGIMVLSGRCRIDIDKQTCELGRREDVFNGLPEAMYISAGLRFKVFGGSVELAVCKSKANKSDGYKIVNESDIKVNIVGKGNWQREVRIAIPPKGFSQNLIMGETLNPAGNWSGTPAHKHESHNLPEESLHEELYYFKTDKPQGWGIQRLYSPERNVNEFIYLQDHTVTFMPWGYHQIVAGPGYTLYYLFFLAGMGNDLCGYEDPEHNWIKNELKKGA